MKDRIVTESEKIANIEGDWCKALKAHMDKKKSIQMDWCGLEATLRAYVRATKNHDVDMIVAEFTGRGYELPCPKCGKELHTDDSCD